MRKNVLIFGHSFGPQFIDVSNQYTKLFDAAKYKVTVVYLVGGPDEMVRKKHDAEQVIFLNYSRKSVRGLKIAAILAMLKLQRENQFQLVICHRYKPTYIMLLVSWLSRIPLLFSVMHEIGTLKLISRKCTIALLAKKNVIFAGVSNAVRDDMRKTIWRIPPERVITLYNMADVETTETQLLTREAARAQLHLPQDAFIFGNISRLDKNKDQQTLINAFALCKKPAKLVIIGAGRLERELKQQVETLGLTNDVIFMGFVPFAFRFMKAFDVYISSSIQEAFGRVLLEAMIAKVPVIATRVNGVPEVIDEAGILIDAADPAQLAAAMIKTFQQTPLELSALGERGYQRALTHFSLTQFKKLFWQLPSVQAMHDGMVNVID